MQEPNHAESIANRMLCHWCAENCT